MVLKYAPPSRNSADNDTMPGLFKLIFDKHLQQVDDMLPAQVIAYDAATNRAQVQPLISMVTTANEISARGQVASVPVAQFGGGGWVIRFAPKTGDLGWIKANDRDISFFKKTLAQSAPNTQRKHDFADSMFIPDTMLKGFTVASEDVANAVIQNAAGTVKIAFWPTYIKMVAPGGVGIGGNPNAHAILDLQSTTKAFIFPRMSTGQRDAIPSPAEGMAVWLTDTHALSTYNGSSWS